MAETTKVALSYEDLVDSVTNISRKYARNCSIDREDLEQEIWVKLYSLNEMPSDIALARTIMINTAIDISRRCWRISNKMAEISTREDSQEAPNSEFDKFTYDLECEDTHSEEGYELSISEEIIRSALKELSEKERKYVVAKGYLSANIEFFADDFKQLIKDLSSESKKILLDSANGDSDDAILKIIMGIKTGTNSGSIRTIKSHLHEKFRNTLLGIC